MATVIAVYDVGDDDGVVAGLMNEKDVSLGFCFAPTSNTTTSHFSWNWHGV